ncbi:proline-rich protein 5-like [Ornithodoros turicata]|uniref:proline-rich protein 5-like n=1 Tax=Ornithodoros turicata TaxID=34597 RepID=UPI003138FEA7
MPLSVLQHDDLRKSTMIALLGRSPMFHRRTHSAFGAFGTHTSSSPLLPTAEALAVQAIVVGSVGVRNLPESEALNRQRRPASLMVTKSSDPQRPSTGQGILPKNSDWIRLQKAIQSLFKSGRVSLGSGELAMLHEKVRALSMSKAAPFIYDSFKREVEMCFGSLHEELSQLDRTLLLTVLAEEWEKLHNHVLPTVDLIMYAVKSKGGITVRQCFLVAFRDVVLTKLELEDLLDNAKCTIPPGIKHMLLTVYNVSETYPPSKSKLKLEGLVARVVSPFLGFLGLYEGSPQPVIRSSEHDYVTRKKSTDDVPVVRKISRPMTGQPRQIETLNELFLTALRKHPDF